MSTLTGKDLHRILLLNRKSLTLSAKKLGITVEELQSYFLMDCISKELVDNIQDKLNLYNIVEMPGVITPKCQDILEVYKFKLRNQAKIIKGLYEVIRRGLPEVYKNANCIKPHTYFKNYDPSK